MFPLIRKSHGGLKNDVLSGLTVALALVPEAIEQISEKLS